MQRLNGVSKIMGESQSNLLSNEFMRTASALSREKDSVREALQAETSGKITQVISKLKSNAALSPDDIEIMKLWIVGDAASYTQMENNLSDWLAEFERLKNVILGYEAKDLSFEDLFKLHGILEDALRVSADIGNFLGKKERLAKFESATSTPSDMDNEILVKILEQKMKSPQY